MVPYKGRVKVNVIFVVVLFSSLASCVIHRWTGLGDSYASGIGAGERAKGNDGDTVCSRYTEAYPNVMNIVIDASFPTNRIFHWPACSGATTKSVMDTQVSVIDGNSDIATLTVGGNDIGFGDAANACVFKVNRFPDCSATLANTGNRIANDLPPKMDSLLTAIMNQVKNPGFKLYVTGYPHFWNVDTTQCDDVDFNFWADTTPNKLTRDLRIRMNGLTQDLNNQIQAAVGRANSRDQRRPVVYVDVSPAYNGHRYCDIGIQEPDPNINNPNEQRWFQENWLFQQNLEFSGSSDAIQWQTWAEQQLAADPSLTVNNLFTQHGTGNGNSASNGVGFNITSNTWLFDGLNRAFHPTVDGQDGIKNVLLAAYKAHPPNGGGNGAYALTPVSTLPKRTVAVEALDEPVVTVAPKARAFMA